MVHWLEFYRRDYTPVGTLVGRYFDSEGQPTAERAEVLARAAEHGTGL